jgi:high-affinity nickel-transport protein
VTVGPLALLGLGFLLGLRHATDADHVVAVTTIVCRTPRARAAMAVGALWGVGHTATLLAVGGAIVVFGAVVPPRVGVALEMAVAVMLILLGARNLRARAGTQPGAAVGGRWQAMAIGVVHGLAGSAAIALLVLATIRDRLWALVYLALFGAGTLLGMMFLTTVMTLPLTLASRRVGALERRVARVTGTISLAFGTAMAYRLGIALTSAP